MPAGGRLSLGPSLPAPRPAWPPRLSGPLAPGSPSCIYPQEAHPCPGCQAAQSPAVCLQPHVTPSEPWVRC